MSVLLTGLRAWVVQRVTAVYLTLYLLYAAVAWSLAPPAGFAAWQGWLASPPVAVATALAFLALFYHAWVGIRDIVLDYVRPMAARAAVLGLVMAALLAQGVWVLLILAGLR